MTLLYTTEDAIFNRLRGRLTQDSVFSQGTVDVDPGLLNQIGAQVESRVNARLSTLYRAPLVLADAGTRALLSSIVEKLVCCELIPLYYPAQADDGTSPYDNYGRNCCTQGAKELKDITDGLITLSGETPVGGPNTLIRRNVTAAARRLPVKGRPDAQQINWGGIDNARSRY